MTGASRPRTRLRVAAAVLAVLALAGCGGTPAPAPSTSAPGPLGAPPVAAPEAPAAPSSTSAPTLVELTTEVSDTLGRRTAATLTGPVGARTPDARLVDGSVVVTATLTATSRLRLTVGGAVWEVLADGSAVLRDAGATGGAGRPPALAAEGTTVVRTTTTTADDGRTLVVALEVPTHLGGTAADLAADVTVTVAARAVERATWADDVEGGRSLQVVPTAFGRSGSAAALEAVRTELVAREPAAATTVMDHQLRCHALGAPTKASWNLEPWRPEVGYLDYLLARCNPTSSPEALP